MKFKEWVSTISEGLRVVKFKQSGNNPHIATFGNIQLKLMKDSETGEYVVAYHENGKYQESPSYRTNDMTDAMQTMDSMAREIVKNQQKNGLRPTDLS